ncbi:MAG: methylglutamate dehydrogenase [Pseudomonadota bacterium]
MSRRDAAWLAEALPERRFGVKGPRAADALKQLGLSVPPRANSWAPLRAQDRDDSWNVVGRLGTTEFFIEERGEAAGITALEQLTAGDFAGAYPVLREDSALVLGGEAVADVLAQVCNVNFAALEAAQRPVVMTLMASVGVLVLPQLSLDDGAIYRIWCDPSFGPYLWETLEAVVQKIPGRSP